jgi:hypothetical protein
MAISSRLTSEKRGRPVVIGELTIVPVEQTSIDTIRLAGQTFITGSKRPIAVIIQSEDREWRLALATSDSEPD